MLLRLLVKGLKLERYLEKNLSQNWLTTARSVTTQWMGRGLKTKAKWMILTMIPKMKMKRRKISTDGHADISSLQTFPRASPRRRASNLPHSRNPQHDPPHRSRNR